MLWNFFVAAGELYAVVSVIGVVLMLAVCKSNSHVRDQEDFEGFERWQSRKLEEEKALYRH